MRTENLRLILQSYIECKQNQDEFDGPENLAEFDGSRNLAVEFDEPCLVTSDSPFIMQDHAVPQMWSPTPTSFHSFPFGSAALPNNVIRVGRELTRMAHQFSAAHPDKSIIKFKEICMVKEPIEQIISIPVIRDQNFSQKVTKALWKTCDKTALSGTHYIESSGEMIFNQGEISKDIQIKILNSADEADDLRFTVELNYDGLYLPTPLTVSLKKINNLEPSEKTVLDSLPRSLPFSISDIKYVLDGCLNARTFQLALTHLCSTTKVVDVQIALACELSSLCLCKASGRAMPGETILRVLTDFFRRDNYDF